VDLENAKQGVLGQQGITRVVKVADGQLAYASGNASSDEMMYNTVRTPRGGQYQIVLPDGTKVLLNAASSLRFPTAFCGNDRVVELEGEAYFEVPEHHAKPFTVRVGVMTVEALGTRFDIMAYKNEPAFRATLVQGSLRVSNGTSKAIIRPGTQAVLADQGRLGPEVSEADLDQALAWKEGKFWLEDADIGSVMRQVSRWYDVDVQMNKDLPDVRLSGSVSRKEDAGQLLEVLEASTGLRFLVEGKRITVTRPGK
jgi:ferric-dicitrate binding protein FerR (iron transport regulator)